MKVTHIDLVSTKERVATFSFRDPNTLYPYMARAIIGIDADEIVPRFYGVGKASGEKFYDFARRPREVVIRIVLNPNRKINFSYSDLRDDLYRVISASRTGDVELFFKQGAVVIAGLKGKVVKFEAPHFSETPEVQITIQCEDAMLRGISPIILDEIELSNGGPDVYIYDAVSTAPHGVEFTASFTANNPDFVLKDGIGDDSQFRVVYDFLVGDILTFRSTNVKSISVTRGANTTKIADRIDITSVWPVVFPGANLYKLGDHTKYKILSASYLTAFWGV